MTAHLRLPFTEVHLSSTLLFDFGVYFVVVGGTVLILIALAHQSLRSRRQQPPDETVTRVWRSLMTKSGRPP